MIIYKKLLFNLLFVIYLLLKDTKRIFGIIVRHGTFQLLIKKLPQLFKKLKCWKLQALLHNLRFLLIRFDKRVLII